MARLSLAQLTRRQRNVRRSAIVLRDILPPATLATDLYRSVYAPIVAVWSSRVDRIVGEYARTLSTMTHDSPADVQREIDEAASEVERLFIQLDAALRQWALRTETWVRGKWRGAVLSATNVDLQTMLGPEDVRGTLDSYIAWNTDLIRDVSDQTKKRVADRVFSGLTQRKPARDVAREIREATGMARDRSQRIAADQLSKISGSLADERRREAGISDWVWMHSGKRHPRQQHVARDGNCYTDDPARVGKAVGGKTLLAPPERGDRPSQQPYCGCRARALISFD